MVQCSDWQHGKDLGHEPFTPSNGQGFEYCLYRQNITTLYAAVSVPVSVARDSGTERMFPDDLLD